MSSVRLRFLTRNESPGEEEDEEEDDDESDVVSAGKGVILPNDTIKDCWFPQEGSKKQTTDCSLPFSFVPFLELSTTTTGLKIVSATTN